MANSAEFRTCPDTGLLFHKPAETLMKLNAVAGIVFLLVGGVIGLLMILTRWPTVHLLQADMFYMLLTAHGVGLELVVKKMEMYNRCRDERTPA